LERADLAQRRCEAATNPKIKEDWLDLELHWVRIAEGYRFESGWNGFWITHSN